MHQDNNTEITFHHEYDREASRKEVIKVTVILSVITLIELALGFMLYLNHGSWGGFMVHFVKGVILILMMAKAFYIVAYFMHLKHELKNMIMTIVVPLLLFVWFIIAFLADGNSYRNLKNTYDPYHMEQSQKKVEKPAHGSGEHEEHKDAKKEGAME
ncbi:cytochrome C oxidase subunit IV family protein [Flavihumibacter rivuli]|uniref:cytochrome C oxidase subunit IV family protein n=1 Tax=Flavihumibacter rivuli TaxID=2838156 RepID=UPI001BDE9170|nr:cytochrome C oxidase subunit IV family protein [Flavihumibacter rivuli]ULQ55528.1 cytochrome C oxidase subunit IV family protein [Flavihumibacter rivuli]